MVEAVGLEAPKWRIRVYENSHYQNEDEAYDLVDVFETSGEAIARAKQIVDSSLAMCAQDSVDPATIISCYRSWGLDPVVTGPGSSGFSAWRYAEQRTQEGTFVSGPES